MVARFQQDVEQQKVGLDGAGGDQDVVGGAVGVGLGQQACAAPAEPRASL